MTSHIINICIYEDAVSNSLSPLTTLRPTFDLLVGIDSLYDKIYRYFNYGNITLHCRDELKSTVKERHPDHLVNSINTGSACLFINGRAILTKELYTTLSDIESEHNYLFTHQGHVVACYLRSDLLDTMKAALKGTPSSKELIQAFRAKCVTKEIESAMMVNTIWDCLNLNQDVIRLDFNYKEVRGIVKGDIDPFASIKNEHNVFIDKNAEIEDFVLIDASRGPVYIEENVYIQSHTRLEGPLFIGKDTHILGGRIRQSSIGESCKVAGEVSNCIFHSHSNKAHSGFIGNSYIGQWVNLGAGTTTSNLKSNYSNITLTKGDTQIETSQLFLGAIIGDHVKTSIGTLLNTGTIIEVGSVLFDAGFHSKYIPPFSWGSPKSYTRHDQTKLMQTARKMMLRRNIELSDAQSSLLDFRYKTI
jgi:UDP-N-acetylglucosamine diphosphorylase/glucosamine-1-phosphate N-acetyltransferase